MFVPGGSLGPLFSAQNSPKLWAYIFIWLYDYESNSTSPQLWTCCWWNFNEREKIIRIRLRKRGHSWS